MPSVTVNDGIILISEEETISNFSPDPIINDSLCRPPNKKKYKLLTKHED
ncbi:3388_t:CDS:2 [Entrophospora sp. SA101]|nr:3388_t:CDS:2 [Entrophospora sp. SA101]